MSNYTIESSTGTTTIDVTFLTEIQLFEIGLEEILAREGNPKE